MAGSLRIQISPSPPATEQTRSKKFVSRKALTMLVSLSIHQQFFVLFVLFCSAGFLSDNLVCRNVLEKGTFLKVALKQYRKNHLFRSNGAPIADRALDPEGSGVERRMGHCDTGSQISISWHDLGAWKRPLSECQKMPVSCLFHICEEL